MSENYGCFTTVLAERVTAGDFRVRGWNLHVERLRRDTTSLYAVAVAPEAIAVAFLTEARACEERDEEFPRIIRLAVMSSDGLVTASSRVLPDPGAPLRLTGSNHERPMPAIKHTGNAGEFALKERAVAAGFDDALLVSAEGECLEGTFWTLVLGRPDGTWVTPAGSTLPSTTLRLASASVEIVTEVVRVDGLDQFDRAAALNATRGVHPIASIDGWQARSTEIGDLFAAYRSAPLDPVVPTD